MFTEYMYRQCQNKHGAHMCVEYTGAHVMCGPQQSVSEAIKISESATQGKWKSRKCCASKLDKSAAHSVPAAHR